MRQRDAGSCTAARLRCSSGGQLPVPPALHGPLWDQHACPYSAFVLVYLFSEKSKKNQRRGHRSCKSRGRCDMYPLYWTPSRGVLLCGTRMSTKGNV